MLSALRNLSSVSVRIEPRLVRRVAFESMLAIPLLCQRNPTQVTREPLADGFRKRRIGCHQVRRENSGTSVREGLFFLGLRPARSLQEIDT